MLDGFAVAAHIMPSRRKYVAKGLILQIWARIIVRVLLRLVEPCMKPAKQSVCGFS